MQDTTAPSTAPPANVATRPSTPLILLLHLVPGAIVTLVYILAAPLATSLGYPTVAGLYVPAILTVIGVELGYLLYLGKKQTGSLSLHGVVEYREPVVWWQYIALPALILGIGILGSAVLVLIDNALLQNVFGWLPDWYQLKDVPLIGAQYPRSTVITLFILALLLNGLAGPIVEELYFRGYLLPHLEKFGRLAPLINGVLFSLYHFWAPWQFFTRLAIVLPLVYIVRWKRNIYIGMIAHCAANSLGTSILFLSFLR